MSDELWFKLTQAGNGKMVTTIAGKTFEVVALYGDRYLDGHFFIAVSGKQVLDWDNIGEHWKVIGKGGHYFAFRQRAFSYHLAVEGGETPLGCKWPKLKTPYSYFAVVGATTAAIEAQARLLRDRYHPGTPVRDLLVREVDDVAGDGPPAWIMEL